MSEESLDETFRGKRYCRCHWCEVAFDYGKVDYFANQEKWFFSKEHYAIRWLYDDLAERFGEYWVIH